MTFCNYEKTTKQRIGPYLLGGALLIIFGLVSIFMIMADAGKLSSNSLIQIVLIFGSGVFCWVVGFRIKYAGEQEKIILRTTLFLLILVTAVTVFLFG